jgi:hypothetical protein
MFSINISETRGETTDAAVRCSANRAGTALRIAERPRSAYALAGQLSHPTVARSNAPSLPVAGPPTAGRYRTRSAAGRPRCRRRVPRGRSAFPSRYGLSSRPALFPRSGCCYPSLPFARPGSASRSWPNSTLCRSSPAGGPRRCSHNLPRLGPVTVGENALARSPHVPCLRAVGPFVDFKDRDLGSGQFARSALALARRPSLRRILPPMGDSYRRRERDEALRPEPAGLPLHVPGIAPQHRWPGRRIGVGSTS